MANQGRSALGTTLSWAGNAIAELDKIGGIELSADAQEITTLGDTSKTYISGVLDGGDVEIEGFFYPGDTNGQVVLKSAVGGASAAVVITFPSAFGANWSFNAICTKFSTGDVEIEGGLRFTATLKITGGATLNISASNNLSALTVSNSGVFVPAFAAGTYSYVVTVLTGVTSVTFTPTASLGVITVNGSVVASGNASSAIILGAAGSLTSVTIVVTETGKTPKTYTISVLRA
jgi:hypothetical protein